MHKLFKNFCAKQRKLGVTCDFDLQNRCFLCYYVLVTDVLHGCNRFVTTPACGGVEFRKASLGRRQVGQEFWRGIY